MAGIRRIIGVVHIVYAVVIAAAFVLWRTGVVDDLWDVINVLSFVVILLAFYFNWERKRRHDASGETGITREYLESNVLYFATMILAALFLFNWLNLLVNGFKDVNEEVMHDVVWIVVDIMIIVVSGATGGYLLKGSSSE